MNLLRDAWIPIQIGGVMEKISLQQLLCGEKEGELCLPRDDMEFACLQLICAITQVLFVPEDNEELKKLIRQPLLPDVYLNAIKGKEDWFDLDHPETPFMQFRGVKENLTTMDKLLAGVADGTNKTFVNPQGLGDGLCKSCTAIALFNTASNCKGVGGGFKDSLRSPGAPAITILLKGNGLRQTTWLNVLTVNTLKAVMPWFDGIVYDKPNYVDVVKNYETIFANKIGLIRGLFWQPSHCELIPPTLIGECSSCGEEDSLYTGYNKEKFKYEIKGVWPHPLSSRYFKIKNGEKEEKFPSFTTLAPSWAHMSRLLVAKQTEKEGQQPAPVVQQASLLIKSDRIKFLVGGYRNNQAMILERRHDFFDISQGWGENSNLIDQLVEIGLSYKSALRTALWIFSEGIKDKISGTGINLCDPCERRYYNQTQNIIESSLSKIDFEQPQKTFSGLHDVLKIIVKNLFDQATEPYRQEPKMLKALAWARRKLNKSISELTPKEQEGGQRELVQ